LAGLNPYIDVPELSGLKKPLQECDDGLLTRPGQWDDTVRVRNVPIAASWSTPLAKDRAPIPQCTWPRPGTAEPTLYGHHTRPP